MCLVFWQAALGVSEGALLSGGVMDIHPEEWPEHRRHLMAVAYRILGSITESEDAVQEAYVRLRLAPEAEVESVRAWLITVVSRLSLDRLRSARARRELYVGPWLPEPLVGRHVAVAAPEPDPDDQAVLTESVEMALLVVLESLTPAERAAFVLRDVFGTSYDQIARIVGRSEAACRQLTTRARRHVRDHTPRYDIDKAEHARVVSAFISAIKGGDLLELLALLDPDVIMRSDGGGVVPANRYPVAGADKVARLLLHGAMKWYADAVVHTAPVNGAPGIVLRSDGHVLAVVAVTIAGGQITAINFVVNPDKLRHVPAARNTATWP